MHLPTAIVVASLALEQSYHCSSASEAIPKELGKSDLYQTTAKHKKLESCYSTLETLYVLCIKPWDSD